MKNYSSHKKMRMEPELSHKIQSKLLITSISKQTNTLPSTVLSKYDHFRCQQEFQKEYNQKFRTDRKHNSNTKKLSSSKSSFKDFNKSKQGQTIEPQRLFFEGEDYHQKFNQLQAQHLKQKQRWIGEAGKLLGIKQAILEFLQCPDNSTAQDLVNLLDNQKMEKPLRRHMDNYSRWKSYQLIIKDIMKILQIQQKEDIVQTLRVRVERFRNLDQCTYKILELESTNKKILIQFEQKIKRMRKQQQECSKRQIDRIKEDLELSKRSKMFLQQEINLQKEQYQFLLQDLNHIIDNEQDTPRKWVSGRNQVVGIYNTIRSLNHKLRDIEVEAEQNMFRLLKSNQQMVKLQNLMSLIKDDMTKQITEQEQINQENICENNQLNRQIDDLQIQLQELKNQNRTLIAEKCKLNNEFDDQRCLIATSLGLKDHNSAKITLKLQELLRQLTTNNLKIEQLRQIINEKDELIKDLTTQIDKTTKMSNQLKEATKTALYQKEQYKFLLNNLRDQVTQMKKQHNDQKIRIIQQKDEQIINSNRQILTSHAKINDQKQALKIENTKIRFAHEQTKAQLQFLKKKEESISKLLREKQAQLIKLIQESQRYKKYLRQIQSSFKEVVDMEEVSSKKVINLESDNEHHQRLIKAYQSKNEDLEASNNQLIQNRNQLKTELQKCTIDLKQIRDERVRLQSTNVQLRLMTISKQTQINRLQQQLKNMTKQSKTLKISNDKLSGELNSVTRKLVMSRLETKKKFTDKYKILKQMLQYVKKQHQNINSFIKNQIDRNYRFVKESFMQNISTILILQSKQHQQQHKKYNFERSNDIQLNRAEKQTQSETALLQDQSVNCQIISFTNHSSLINKISNIYQEISNIVRQHLQLRSYISQFKKSTFQDYQKIVQLLQNQSNITSKPLPVSNNDNPLFEYLNSENSIEQPNNNNIAVLETSQAEVEEIGQIGQIVNSILQILLQNQTQIPSVAFWQKIQTNFLLIRRKIYKKNTNLKLDLSSIDNRQPALQSPCSAYFGECDGLKRMGSEPDEVLQIREYRDKETNRSQRYEMSENNFIETLKNENKQLKVKLISHIQANAQLEFKNHEQQQAMQDMQLKIQQLEIQLVSFQNQSSILGLQHNFKKLLENLLIQNVDSFEQTARIIMKLLHFQAQQISQFEQKISTKKKKKKSGIFSGFFKN